MKSLLVILAFCLLSLSAFADEKPSSHYCMPNSTSISCRLELALVCGQGYQDGCLTGQTSTHKCILQPSGASCIVPVEILCVAGLRDGCISGRTTRHQCVPYVGPSCDSGADFSCPEGFHDSCDSISK